MSKRQGIGLNYPIFKGSEGYFQLVYDSFASERIKLINLISTIEGERYMQPTFGLGVHKYLFEQSSPELSYRLESEVRNKIEFWLPNLLINTLNIDILQSVDRNQINMTIDFSLKSNPVEFDTVSFQF